jgi:tRNA (guanosine-2'-O-)-methyltransferase
MAELAEGLRSDDPRWTTFGDTELRPEDVVDILTPWVAPDRSRKIEQALRHRTDEVAVVVEGMVDLGNVGAVMRSADGFGIQSVHVVDTAGAYKRSRRTTRGADKWLDRYSWPDADSCASHLRANGFRIVAAHMEAEATPIAEADLTDRLAIVLGNELGGVSDEMLSMADDRIHVPMDGFTESFNISVAAAVILFEVRRQRIARSGAHGDLDEARRRRLRAVWYMTAVRGARQIVERAIADGYRSDAT